ncbi:hypothetical protein AYO47_05140 [Planctomyces sp. SCGC AG-212-M04]|nr:hypothetical protein AYO47_05140 [Planctomyces sp. SCGC AG-212-M04]
MESSLHRQLKELYGGSPAECEVTVQGFRIDAVAGGRLVEIQRASLGAIRDKIATLVESHRVTLVKPIAARTLIVRRQSARGEVTSQRYSPLKRGLFHLFEELVHFGRVFPHPRLELEVVLMEQEERRIARVRRRFNGPDYRVEDRLLLGVVSRHRFQTAADLAALLPATLPSPFHTQDLAEAAAIPRWLAQKMTYCLARCGAIEIVGKFGRSVLYEAPAKRARRRKSA